MEYQKRTIKICECMIHVGSSKSPVLKYHFKGQNFVRYLIAILIIDFSYKQNSPDL